MAASSYDIKLTPSAIQVIAEHLKRGVYNDVRALLDDIQSQVTMQDQAAEQADLQVKVRAAGLQLVEKTEAA